MQIYHEDLLIDMTHIVARLQGCSDPEIRFTSYEALGSTSKGRQDGNATWQQWTVAVAGPWQAVAWVAWVGQSLELGGGDWNMFFFLLFHILGMSQSQLNFIFFRGFETTNQRKVAWNFCTICFFFLKM